MNLMRLLMRCFHSRARSRGQALVEMALVSVALLLILSSVLDFGRIFYTQITVENAARAGALVAARAPNSYTGACPAGAPTTNRIGCAIAAESRGSGVTVQASEVTVSCETTAGTAVNPCPATPQPGQRSRVAITKPFGFLMPILSIMFGSSLDVSASVAADQESLPAAATFIPGPSSTPAPTPTPPPTPSASPTAVPTPTPTPAPCLTGFAPMPDLVVGVTPGSTETVSEARAEWVLAGFDNNKFNPSNGSTNKTVTGQGPLVAGQCYSIITTTVTVTHT